MAVNLGTAADIPPGAYTRPGLDPVVKNPKS